MITQSGITKSMKSVAQDRTVYPYVHTCEHVEGTCMWTYGMSPEKVSKNVLLEKI